MATSSIINAVFGSGLCAVTTSAYRANYGMVLRFSGIALPTAFEVDFSNYDVMGRDSITAIGQNNEVQIPDDLWDSGLNIYAYVYLHPTDDSGVTVYTVTIPVLGRPNRTDEEPTPHEQTVIEQAISALNDAVEQTAADVDSADASAQAAAQSEANASVSERAAAASASAALASQNAAESASQSATESASGASESAQNAANSASQAAQSATSAQESAEQAEQAVQSITDDVERAERAAATATGKATEAASSAATASTKAAQAEQSATAAAQSASSASTAAQNAASSATAAESSAAGANTAKTAAQAAQTAAETAQAAAEQAAQSVSGLSEQIEQNTADIADLVQSKAGALVDTVSGSIASFVPDATIPTVKGLTVDIEPQQDLHGYDNPWPAGGGKNLFNYENTGFTLASMGQSGSVFSNTNTDSRTFFNFQFRALNNGTVVVTSDAQSISSTGRKSATITISETITHVSIVHNGSQRNLSVTYPFTGQGTFTISFDVTAYNPSSVGGLSFKDVQIESGSTATAYAPYSNICPISGWDAVEVKHSGADMTNPTTYTIQLGQTVYGGTLDVINGVLTVDRAMFTFTGAESFIENTAAWGAYAKLHNAGVAILSSVTNERTISSHFERSSGDGWGSLAAGLFMTAGGTFIGIGFDGSISELQAYLASQYSAGTPVQVVALLATPITVDLTPIEVAVLTGQTNNVWADSGDVSVEYAADLKTYINNKIAAVVAALS